MSTEVTNFTGVTVTVTVKRTLYIESNEQEPEADIIERVKKEIILPQDAINAADIALKNVGVRINKLDLGDWSTEKVEYIINK